MAKHTLLDIVQEILSDMNSDAVNSISDTVESMQVATIVKRTYINLCNDRIWPAYKRLLKLVPYGDGTRPVYMKFDEAVIQLDWIKYDVREAVSDPENYQDVQYCPPDQFIEILMGRDPSASNVETVLDPHNSVPLFVLNDAAPSYWTTFDDDSIVFDSYDAAVDSTLQASKTQAYGEVEPDFEMSDTFVPNMPLKYFPLLVNEAKSVAFLKIKEVASQPDMYASMRQKGWLSRNKHRGQPYGIRYPDYGRKAGGGGRYSRAGYRNNNFTG